MQALKRAGLVVCASILALAAAEIATRLFFPQHLSSSWLMPGPGYNLNRPGVVARHAVDGRETQYVMNQMGLRGAAPRGARVEVLVVGDSFTFGWLLNEQDTYVAKLNARAIDAWGPRGVELLNAGVGGWGTGDYVAFVEDQAAAHEPDAILVFMNDLDVSRTSASGLWRQTAAGQVERNRTVMPHSLLRSISQFAGYRYLVEHSHVAQLARQRVTKAMPGPADRPHEGDPAFAAALAQRLFERLKAWCDRRGVELWVISIGIPPTENLEDQLFAQQADGFFAGIQVPFLDLTAVLGADSGQPLTSLQIPGDGHPNEAANQLLAEAAWPWLKARLTSRVERNR